MYVQVPEIVSYAQRKLIRLIEERNFAPAARSYGITVSNISSLYRMATGKITPSFIMIFNLRQHIAPVEWFYDEDEKLPEKKKLNPLYTCFTRRFRQHIIRHPTVGIKYLEELFLQGELNGFCRERGLNYSTVYGYSVKRKRYDGVTGYHSRPGYGFIKKVRAVIHPDDWFMFPEEV
jgi:hypothetical protein